jgi:hypothetical protein
MGLLDEAIREHLALRRRHGADPGEVAREEHDALGAAEPMEGVGDPVPALDDRQPVAAAAEAVRDQRAAGSPDAFPETVELDMRKIFEADRPEREGSEPGDPRIEDRDRTAWMLDDGEDLSAWDLPVRARRLERSL